MLFAIFLVILLLDQVSKAWILNSLELHQSIPVINGVFHLTLVKNTGAAFGVLPYQRTLLVIVALIVIILLLYFIYRTNLANIWHKFALGLGLGGIVGNLIDRIRFGYVVDFLDFRVWPVFNLADSAIVVSAGLLILFFILKGE